jgi:hypothetical protein
MEQYIKRLKSFAWRTGMMVLALFIDFTATNLGVFELPPEAILILGLLLGEISKFINTQLSK